MAFSSGTYTLPGPALNTGDTVSATENNNFRNDVATAFNLTWLRNGTAVATANLPMGGFKLTGLAAGSANGDSVRFEQLPSGTNLLPVGSGGTGASTLIGLVKGNGTSAFTAAAAGTDYLAPPSGTAILKANSGGALANATAGTDYVAPGTATNFTAQQYFGNVALTDAATISWTASAAQVATFTFVSSNRTMGAPTGLVNGAFYALAVIQNSGSNTLSWNSVFKWANGAAPTLSTAAGARDYFVFRSDGTNLYEQGRALGVA